MIEPNIPLLRKTMEYIEDHPEEWNQHHWAHRKGCGTTLCFAGTAVMLMGYKILWNDTSLATDVTDVTGWCAEPDGYRAPIPDAAMRELGLTQSQSDVIFHLPTQAPAEFRKYLEDVIGEKL